LKKFLLVLISTLATPFYTNFSAGCGGGEQTDITDISMFAPEIIRQENMVPLFLTHEPYYNYDDESTGDNSNDTNATEWAVVLQHQLSAEDVSWLIYKCSVPQLLRIILYYNGQDSVTFADMPAGLHDIRKVKIINEQLEYLRFAKLLEPATYRAPYEWEAITYSTAELDSFAPFILNGFKKTKDAQLKARYAFQYLRIQYLTGRYESGVEFFNKNAKLKPGVGSMYYRCLGYKAGMLYKLKRYAGSNYIFSLIFDCYAPMRIEGYYGFHPWEEEDWKNTLAMAKNTHEKEVLWQLFGVYADPFRSMKEIMALNPSSDKVQLLLMRSVNIAEIHILKNAPEGEYWYNEVVSWDEEEDIRNSYHSWKTIDSVSSKVLLSFMEEMISKKKIAGIQVWKTSAAYLAFLLNDYEKCRFWLAEMEKENVTDGLLKGQNDITRAVLFVTTLQELNEKEEAEMLLLIQRIEAHYNNPELRKENALRYLHAAMSEKYGRQGEDIKEELSRPSSYEFYSSKKNVQRMIDFMLVKNLSGLENYLVSHYDLKLPQLYSIQAADLMYKYRFSEAAALYKREDIGKNELQADPFIIHVKDCHDCDHQAPKTTVYTEYTFALRMSELKESAMKISSGEESAKSAFLFANGLYNMSSMGNSRALSEPVSYDSYTYGWSRTVSEKEAEEKEEGEVEAEVEAEEEEVNAEPVGECSEALKYYRLALKSGNNKEFRAKCAWMCAKCEYSIWLENGSEGTGDFVAGTYFKMMKEKFADTEYYKEVISECSYFCKYAGGDCSHFHADEDGED